jgi:IMP cyclohydrolase
LGSRIRTIIRTTAARNGTQTDTIKALRLDLTHPARRIFKSVDFGFDYSDRKKVKSAVVDFAYPHWKRLQQL